MTIGLSSVVVSQSKHGAVGIVLSVVTERMK